MGETLGPILSGTLNYSHGFTESQQVLAVIVGLFTLLYLFTCTDSEIFKPTVVLEENQLKRTLFDEDENEKKKPTRA